MIATEELASPTEQTISVSIANRDFKVKCPPEKAAELQNSAQYLDKKIHEIRASSKTISLDRIAVIAALNITHELLAQKRQNQVYIEAIHGRIQNLQEKIENALAVSD